MPDVLGAEERRVSLHRLDAKGETSRVGISGVRSAWRVKGRILGAHAAILGTAAERPRRYTRQRLGIAVMFRTRAFSVLVTCMSCAPKTQNPPPVVAHEVAATPAVSSNEATTTPTPKSAGTRHVMPNGLVHVTLVGFDDVPAIDSELPSARSRHAAVAEKYKATYQDPGDEAWFFHAFDSSSLEFVIARWQPSPRVGGKEGGSDSPAS